MPAKKEEMKKKQTTQVSLQAETSTIQRTTKHQKAGLIFPVARVLRLMRKGRYAERISPQCAVGVAAVLEYLTAEILEMSGDVCLEAEKNKNVQMLKPRHICLAVKGDEEMNRALGPDVIIPMGGVIPFIHEGLENSKRKRKRKSMGGLKDDEAEESGEGSEDDDEEEISTGDEHQEESEDDEEA